MSSNVHLHLGIFIEIISLLIMNPKDLINPSLCDLRERSNTWPCSTVYSHQHQTNNNQEQKQYYGDCHYDNNCDQYNQLSSDGSLAYSVHSESPMKYATVLSHINESNESLKSCTSSTTTDDSNKLWDLVNQKCYRQAGLTHGRSSSFSVSSTPSIVRNSVQATSTPPRIGHPSYVELITQAILMSPGQRLTLAEIYDWMVNNVDAFRNQRHLHSSTGWKNSVRHNLSLHSRFKRVKRNGMDKPSWWTVDLNEESKRYRGNSLRSNRSARTSEAAAAVLPSGCPRLSSKSTSQKGEGSHSCQVENVSISTMPLIKNHSETSAARGRQGRVVRRTVIANSEHYFPYRAPSFNDVRSATAVKELLMSNYANEPKQFALDPCKETDQTTNVCFLSVTDSNYPCMMGVGSGTSSLPSSLSSAMTADLAPPSYVKCWPSSNIAEARNAAAESSALFASGEGYGGETFNDVAAHLPEANTAIDQSAATNGKQVLSIQTSAGSVERVSLPAPMELKIVVQNEQQCQTDRRPLGCTICAFSTSSLDDQALHSCLKRHLLIDSSVECASNLSAFSSRRHTYSSGAESLSACSYGDDSSSVVNPDCCQTNAPNPADGQMYANFAPTPIGQRNWSDWLHSIHESAPYEYNESRAQV